MKENIVVCCEDMFRAFGRGLRYQDHVDSFGEVHRGVSLEASPPGPQFEYCPFCGKELPFPYEEAK
ncbi:MAG TPA: hypothetical protein VMW58_09290 [Anaerolineae bacterium]|nr:hypothetical protein [Anaerolineae bacterium]